VRLCRSTQVFFQRASARCMGLNVTENLMRSHLTEDGCFLAGKSVYALTKR